MSTHDLDLGGWAAALESSPALLSVVVGPELTVALQNARSREALGARPLGVPFTEAFPEVGMSAPLLHKVRETGEVLEVRRRSVGVRDVVGDALVLHYVVAPFGEGPPYPAVVMTAIDVTPAARAEQAAERAGLLALITAGITDAAGPDEALQFLTDALVAAVADVAAVFVIAPQGQQGAANPPTAVTISEDLLGRLGPPPPPNGDRAEPAPWDDSLSAGRTVLIDLRSRPDLEAINPQSRTWLERADTSTVAVLPLVVAGELSGAVVLAACGNRPPYSADDVPFLEDLAARAGTAVAHLRSVRRQWQVALDLQRALLPVAQPELPGFDVACRYVAGSQEVDVGGDWWDIAHLGAGRLGVGVGDVSGRGVLAAAVMGQARAAMRAAAHADLPPGHLLSLLDTQLADLLALLPIAEEAVTPPRFATALYAVFEPFEETLRIASAGHPPLLVRAPDGAVQVVAAPPGPPLGLGIGPFEEVVVPFPAGSLLAAFTDGLVESRDLELDAGIQQLCSELRDIGPDRDLDEAADHLLKAVGVTAGHDDVALVLLRPSVAAVPSVRIERTLMHLSEVSAARRAVDALATGAFADRADEIVHVTSELVANALEHGGAPVTLRAQAGEDRFVVATTDASALSPLPVIAGEDDERGRGLAIVAMLAQAWGVRRSPGGKTTWAEFRP